MASTFTPSLHLELPDLDDSALVTPLLANFTALDALLTGATTTAGKLRFGGAGVAIGPTAGDPSSYLVVTHAYAPPTVGAVLLDVGLDTTSTDPASDQGAERFVARQSASGRTLLRALETHVVRDGAALSAGTWAQEIGVHSSVAGDGTQVNVGLRIDSSHAGWLAAGGVRNDSAVLILGQDGWSHGVRYLDTDASVLFDVDQLGRITARALILATVGGLVDFSGQVAGTIRGGSGSLNLQNAAGTQNNVAVADNGDVAFRAGAVLSRAGTPLNQWVAASLASTTVPAATTSFATPGTGGVVATENQRQTIVPRAGTVRNLYLATSTAQPGDGTLVCTVRKNNADTAVTLTVAAGAAAGTFSDTTHAVAFAAGDTLDLRLTNGSPGTVSAAVIAWGVTFDA